MLDDTVYRTFLFKIVDADILIVILMVIGIVHR